MNMKNIRYAAMTVIRAARMRVRNPMVLFGIIAITIAGMASMLELGAIELSNFALEPDTVITVGVLWFGGIALSYFLIGFLNVTARLKVLKRNRDFE